MAQQNINVGTNPNDGTGDSLRLSMQKTQANFDELYARNASDIQVSKTITANTIINDSFHNAIVFIKASATITLPAGLRTDLNFVTQTFTGCIATYVVGAGATISTQSSGTTQAEDKDGSVRKDGANNYILRGI